MQFRDISLFFMSPILDVDGPAQEDEGLFHWDTESEYSESDDSDFDPRADLCSSDESDSDSS